MSESAARPCARPALWGSRVIRVILRRISVGGSPGGRRGPTDPSPVPTPASHLREFEGKTGELNSMRRWVGCLEDLGLPMQRHACTTTHRPLGALPPTCSCMAAALVQADMTCSKGAPCQWSAPSRPLSTLKLASIP